MACAALRAAASAPISRRARPRAMARRRKGFGPREEAKPGDGAAGKEAADARGTEARGAATARRAPGCGRENCSFGGDPEILSCHAATTRRHRLSEVVCAL